MDDCQCWAKYSSAHDRLSSVTEDWIQVIGVADWPQPIITYSITMSSASKQKGQHRLVLRTGSGGDHRSKLRQALLTRMFDDNVMELLLVIAQHASSVCSFLSFPALCNACSSLGHAAMLHTAAMTLRSQSCAQP